MALIVRASSCDADLEALVGDGLRNRSLATRTCPPGGTATLVQVAVADVMTEPSCQPEGELTSRLQL